MSSLVARSQEQAPVPLHIRCSRRLATWLGAYPPDVQLAKQLRSGHSNVPIIIVIGNTAPGKVDNDGEPGLVWDFVG